MNTDNLDTLMKMNNWKKVKDNFPSSNNAYYLNGFLTYHRNYYMVILGQMPLRKAQELFNSVNKSLGVRADGHGGNIFPKTGHNDAVMDYCGELIENGCPFGEVDKKCEILRQELTISDPDSFYVEVYHIDTWKGFTTFSDFVVKNNIFTEWFD